MSDRSDEYRQALDLLGAKHAAAGRAAWEVYMQQQLATSPFEGMALENGADVFYAGWDAATRHVIRLVVDNLVTGEPPGAEEEAPERSTGTGWPDLHDVRAWQPPPADPAGEEGPATGS